MAKGNGKTEVEKGNLDLEHELPAMEEESSAETRPAGAGRTNASVPTSAVPTSADSELQAIKAERDSLLDRLARMQAEFDNARKRAVKEQQDFRDFATVDAIKPLLPVIDNFERALQMKSEGAEFRAGVELIYKQLQDVLAKLGVKAVAAKGEQFDPHVHEAIEMVETADAPDHEVLEEWQRGYKFKDRLVRPAMVKVAKNPGK
jgi:molecular chaperone GrpE